jgi:hypothetical protein
MPEPLELPDASEPLGDDDMEPAVAPEPFGAPTAPVDAPDEEVPMPDEDPDDWPAVPHAVNTSAHTRGMVHLIIRILLKNESVKHDSYSCRNRMDACV